MGKLKQLFKKKNIIDQSELVPSSFEIIGDILIFRPNKNLKKKNIKLVAKNFLESNKNVKVVGIQKGAFEGKYRLRKIEILAGEKRKETIHKESGVRLKLDVEKCYFSPRSSNERLRIAKLIRPGENVLVMFSGVGVYPLVIAKQSKAKEIYGIELNKIAHEYGLENVKLNKMDNITLIKGDVKKIKLNKKFDRVIMPLPKDAENFLDIALRYIKRGGWIHLYTFAKKDELEIIKSKYSKFKDVKIIKAGVYSPGVNKICIEFKVT